MPECICSFPAFFFFAVKENEMAFFYVTPELGRPGSGKLKVKNWSKSLGDRVEKNEQVAEIENRLVEAEMTSEFSGYLIYQGVVEGSKTEAGELLYIIGQEGENGDELAQQWKNGQITEQDPPEEDWKDPVQRRLHELEKKVDQLEARVRWLEKRNSPW